MNRPFDAEEFVELMNRGAFEGRLTESIMGLSYEQLDQVALLMTNRLKAKRGI